MTETMTTPGGLPEGVIPYVEAHDGPRRIIQLDLTTGNGVVRSKMPPIVGIDGRSFITFWGLVSFEVPADRAVHVSVHVEADRLAQAVSMLLPPDAHPRYRYATSYGSGLGSFTPI